MRAGAAALLVWACAAGPGRADEPAQPAPDPALEAEHGDALYRDQRYREALDEYQRAYSQRRSPDLLYRLARTQQRLGKGREALICYQRFLSSLTDPPEGLRVDAEREVARLETLLRDAVEAEAVPRPETPPSLLREAPGRRKRLLAGGLALTAIGYLPALLTGIVTIASGWPDGVTWPLLVPVIGPVISGGVALAGYQPPISVEWGLPWIILDGTAQVAGLALLIAAARMKPDGAARARVQIAPWSTRGGSGLAAVGRF
jgi:hypothetical protein